MFRNAIALFVLPFLLAACATTQPMAAADRSGVKSVTVSKDVSVPPNMYYLGPGRQFAYAFGIVGALASAPVLEKDRASLQATATAAGTPIDRIVYEEAMAQIRQSGKFPLTDDVQPGGATLRVSILNYGFSVPTGFSSHLVPILYLRCDLTDANGRVVWSSTAQALPLGNPVAGVPADEIKNNPEARDASWRAAAKALLAKIVATY